MYGVCELYLWCPLPVRFFCVCGLVRSVTRPWTGAECPLPLGGALGGGSTIRIGQEIRCLPYAGFFCLLLGEKKLKLKRAFSLGNKPNGNEYILHPLITISQLWEVCFQKNY